MALAITPAIDKWLYQTEAFTIIFKGFDDNGVQCKNKHLSIEYNITYDGTMPDLNAMTRVYSDASGIIALTITRPCVISLYGIYSRDVADDSKGESIQELAINYEITFQPVILSINAMYTGSGVPITESFTDDNILVKAQMSDGTSKIIPTNECIISNYEISIVGENERTLTYTDPLVGTVWNLEFIVLGISKLLSIEAEYVGVIPRALGDRLHPRDLVVYSIYLVEIGVQERSELSSTQWFFIDIPVITDANKGEFRVGYKEKEATITVPYENDNSLRLNVWYEGDKIEVGKTYDPNYIAIFLVMPDGERKRLSYKECDISSYAVTQEGWNWYTATYIVEFKKVVQYFAVEGYIPIQYQELDFKVLYITDKNNVLEENQEDLTETFKTELAVDDIIIIDWKQFLDVVNSIERYGLYIVTVPKLSGLSNKYDMDWEVLCINKTTLKATIKHIYKEEKNNGTH